MLSCGKRNELNLAPILKEFPLPKGARLKALDLANGWFSEQALIQYNEQHNAFERHLEQLPEYVKFGNAFKQLVQVVHKASMFDVYVGRAGCSVQHVPNRFHTHRKTKAVQWIQPVFRVRTGLMRADGWEELAIRWTRSKAELKVLCCNNSVADDRGPWPKTEFSIIYVAAG